MLRSLLAAVLLCAALLPHPAGAEVVKRARYPALSPDGQKLAFSYQGDLWSVPAAGGRATRLTTHPARDIQPVFSPDGKTLVFSSNRYGAYNLYAMPADGGPAGRLTFSSADDYPSAFTPDGQWVVYYGSAYGALDLYKVRVSGGEPVRLTWDRWERKYAGSVSPDGQWIAYDHNSAPGMWRRRGYSGAYNADVWIARLTTPISELRRLTNTPGNEFSPIFAHDGKHLYYVADHDGNVNLWTMDLTGGAQRQLTFHETDGVRLPSYAPEGEKIAYEWNSEVWLLDLKSGKTARVPIELTTDERRNPVVERAVTTQPSEWAVSPDGKKLALIIRGDLFVAPATGGVARKLIGRSSRENGIEWMPDSRTIVFSTDERGQKDLRRIDITGQNEKILAPTEEDETNGLPSPDGKYIAYHRGDHAIVVIPAGGGKEVAVIQGDFPEVSRADGPRFDWSPDNKWLVFEQTGSRMESAVYVAAIADGKPRRVSQYFRDTDTPHFSATGKMIYFVAEAVDSANLYAVDLGEDEQLQFEEDALERLEQPMLPMPGAAPPEVKIDFANVLRRLRRVTLRGGVAEAALTPSGKQFIVEVNGNLEVLPGNARNAAGSPLAEKASGVQLTQDGTRAYFLSDGQVQSVLLATKGRRASPFTATLTVDLHAENRQIFAEAWWLMDRYFFDAGHNGVDWKATRAKYEALLPYTPYKDDFYDLMNEMVQELRGSHLGVSGPTDYTPELQSSTGYVGIEPEWAEVERGRFRVARVTPGSPAAFRWSRLEVGEYILAVDGTPLGKDHTWDQLLDRKAGKKVVLTVNAMPSMAGARQVAIKPATEDEGLRIDYEAWVEHERALVRKLSGGRLAYMHIKTMDRPAEQKFLEEFVSEGTGHDGMLVDVRYNAGGNTAHHMLDLLRKKPYVSLKPRALGKAVDADWLGEYLWGKPAALLINPSSASNTEMMAEGFRSLGIGPLVGMPTMGAVVITSEWTFIDGGVIRVPGAAVTTASGELLERRGRQPDVVVPYDPMAARDGNDPQLERAVAELLKKLPKS